MIRILGSKRDRRAVSRDCGRAGRSVGFWGALLLGALLIGLPREAGADTMNVAYHKIDQRGSVVHAVPLQNDQVRMAAERVVLVPYWDRRKRRPRLLAHVWYDFVNEGPAARLALGFPELKAFFRYQLSWAHSIAPRRVGQGWAKPTIVQLGARVGKRAVPVRVYPGVGRYRRWFTFSAPLAVGQKTRVHTTYLAELGRSMGSFYHSYDEFNSHQTSTDYYLHYVLHTGARWRGPIGRGEILLFHRGRLRRIRRFANLEPTAKDDVGLQLDITTEYRWDCGIKSHGHILNRVDRLRLLTASGQLESDRVDTHAGLVVDGDPATQWVSPRGRALRSFLQLPSDPGRDLKTLRLWSGKPGPGRVRPAKVTLRCLTSRRRTVLAHADLPASAGPHLVSLARPARCQAVRVEVTAVHGDRTAPVAIAEIEQRLAPAAGPAAGPLMWKRPEKRQDPLAPDKDVVLGARRPPHQAGDDPQAFGVVDVDRVMWSRDGTLLHYWLQVENPAPKPSGAWLGVFVDVATGKVVRAYRLDKLGKLPEPYRRFWKQAMSFHQGAALLHKHGFEAARRGRRPPRGSTIPGQTVRLRGVVKGRIGGYFVKPSHHGFRWVFSTWAKGRTGPAETSLKLLYRAKGQAERALVTRAPRMDLAFAERHAAVWKRRAPIFVQAANKFKKHPHYHDVEQKDVEFVPDKWHALTYRNRQAYGGEARLYWHPRGEALAVFWIERKEHSSRQPDPKPEDLISECAWLPIKVCPWDRRDDPRHRVAVTVHPFVRRQPTTLLEPYRAPPPQRIAAGMGSATKANVPRGTAAKNKAKKGTGRGCGCTGSLALLTLFCGSLFLRRRNRS